MPDLILVRHALPNVERGVANKLWGLSEAAREDCVVLAHNLGQAVGGPPIFTSDERKARETADVLALRLGRVVEVDNGFAEVDRPTTWDGDYRAMAAAYVAGEAHDGWEPQAQVVARFTAACERAMAESEGEDVIVVNHGMALSLYLASIKPIDIVPFWQSLSFPDAWALDMNSGVLLHAFEGGLPPPDA